MTLALAIMTGAALGLIVLSAFFSGSETALTTSSRPRLHELEKRGDKRARTVLDLKEQPERLIGGILLGNNLVNILASALATTVFLRLFGETGVVWATLVMTALVLVFGEVLPKTYAIVYPERFSLAVAAIISLFVKIFGPIVIGVEVIVKNVLSLAGVDLANAGNILSPQEEIRGAIDMHHKEGAVVKNDRDMLGGVLDLSELELSDLMVHRTIMFSIDADMPNDDIIAELLKSGFSRAPRVAQQSRQHHRRIACQGRACRAAGQQGRCIQARYQGDMFRRLVCAGHHNRQQSARGVPAAQVAFCAGRG